MNAVLAIARGGVTLLVGLIAGVIVGFCGGFVLGVFISIAADWPGWGNVQEWGSAWDWIYVGILIAVVGGWGVLGVLFAREITRFLTTRSVVLWAGIAMGIPPGFFMFLWSTFATNY